MMIERPGRQYYVDYVNTVVNGLTRSQWTNLYLLCTNSLYANHDPQISRAEQRRLLECADICWRNSQ